MAKTFACPHPRELKSKRAQIGDFLASEPSRHKTPLKCVPRRKTAIKSQVFPRIGANSTQKAKIPHRASARAATGQVGRGDAGRTLKPGLRKGRKCSRPTVQVNASIAKASFPRLRQVSAGTRQPGSYHRFASAFEEHVQTLLQQCLDGCAFVERNLSELS